MHFDKYPFVDLFLDLNSIETASLTNTVKKRFNKLTNRIYGDDSDEL